MPVDGPVDGPVDAPGQTLGAVELLPDVVRAAAIDAHGKIQHLIQRPLGASWPVSDIERAVVDVTRQAFTFQRAGGIGVACPGLVDTASGVIVESLDLPQLNGFPVARVVAENGRAPAYAEHRARLQALGDRWFGHGRGRRAFASVNTGETLGVGIVYDGRLIAPPGGRSGAHMIVAADGEMCTCGAAGCWKTVATTKWLRRAAAAAGLDVVGDLRCVTDSAAAGDSAAARIVNAYADNIALGLANIQHLFAPGRFILHGEARLAGRMFWQRIEDRLLAVTSWSVEAERPQVAVADIDEDVSTLLGGAGLVLSQHG